jgi:hypothetical protein
MKPATPVVQGLEAIESFKGGPRAGQPQYLELPCLITENGAAVTSRWELSPEEREWIAKGGDVYLTIWTGGRPYPPTRVEILRKDGWEEAGNPIAISAKEHFKIA